MEKRLSIIGIGPGGLDHITRAAEEAINQAEVIVGYTSYMRYIESLIAGKERFSTGMRNEKERVVRAIQAAESGLRVAVISGGDAGVYGMAGLVLEMMTPEQQEGISVRIIPGVTAAVAAASLLGAPLMHDFAVISLSDLLTDNVLIEKRLRLAAEGDFVTVLYNPKSRTRKELLKKAVAIFAEFREPDTPAAVVTNALREGESCELFTLRTLDPESPEITMDSVVFIGNSTSRITGSWFVTPRGYQID